MTMWYKGYEDVFLLGVPATDGGAVDQVENQISTTDALQVTAANQPTWHANAVNGKGIVRFDGVNDFLEVAHGGDSNILYPLTFFFIIKIPAFTNYTMLITKGTGGGTQQYSIYINPPGLAGRISYCANTCVDVDGLFVGLWERLIVRLDTGTGTIRLYRNGVLLGTASSPGQTTYVAPALIGKRVDGNFNSYDLLEMGVFNRNLTTQEIADLDCYMTDVVGA